MKVQCLKMFMGKGILGAYGDTVGEGGGGGTCILIFYIEISSNFWVWVSLLRVRTVSSYLDIIYNCFDLWLTLADPYLNFDSSHVLLFSEGFFLPNLVAIRYS